MAGQGGGKWNQYLDLLLIPIGWTCSEARGQGSSRCDVM